MKNHNIFPAASIILSAACSISVSVNAEERESLKRELPTGTVGGLTAKAAMDSFSRKEDNITASELLPTKIGTI
ncbi:MAG TPA: hypothetical protein PKM07_11170 [Spirochaetota bacterium]|nr:hypothetical protein [Spirochaetota bacterium]HPW51106.1 hypothetical protein [Spirochaetota bacterium]